MYALFAQFVRFFAAARPANAQPASPRQLMERAGARAGQNPRQARELRSAARAWLSVVR